MILSGLVPDEALGVAELPEPPARPARRRPDELAADWLLRDLAAPSHVADPAADRSRLATEWLNGPAWEFGPEPGPSPRPMPSVAAGAGGDGTAPPLPVQPPQENGTRLSGVCRRSSRGRAPCETRAPRGAARRTQSQTQSLLIQL